VPNLYPAFFNPKVMSTQVFSASVGGCATISGDIIASRIASRDLTCLQDIPKRPDAQNRGRQMHYRYNILESIRKAGSDRVHGNKLVCIFRYLVWTLENERAVAVPANTPDGFKFEDAWRAMLDDSTDYYGKLQPGQPGNLQRYCIANNVLHPLLVALLAYRMGGPINTVSAPHAHQWKLPDQSTTASDVQNFHMEGDNACIFYSHRMSLVWEETNGQSRGVSGNHHIFLSGEGSESKSLTTASLINPGQISTASTILYDVRNAALVYECQETNSVRNSINLDFYVETSDDDILELLVTAEVAPTTLTELLLSYPIPRYDYYFDRLLFGPESLRAIVNKLSDINITPGPCNSLPIMDPLLKQAEAWYKENVARIPPEISMKHDTRITGKHTSTAVFLRCLASKAHRDAHLQIGRDLFPQNSVEENRECARRYIRDMPRDQVMQHLTQYEQVLTNVPFVAFDILSTNHLHALACKIERKCWDLEGSGFIDPTGILSSLPCLVSALGQAVNGPKEAQRVPDPLVDPVDLQIYRTRCLYLFWCADWLMRYEPVPGPCMLPNANEAVNDLKTGSYQSDAVVLLRNWVAWGMFVERLPSRLVVTRIA
jgi:hypothetical protein